jgi:tetratricopeptide (TPR) repeat protein
MRYRMLETVREYCREKLVASGQAAPASARHRDWYLALAERAVQEMPSVEEVAWLDRLEVEIDNLRAVLRRCLERDDAGGAGRLAAMLLRFWWLRGHLREGREWLDRVLAAPGSLPRDVRGRLLGGAGVLAHNQGDYDGAARHLEEALGLWRELENSVGVASALVNLGNVACERHDYAGAGALYEEGLAIYERLGNRWGIATSLLNLGNVSERLGRLEEALESYERSLALYRELGDGHGAGLARGNLGDVALQQGDLDRAEGFFRESLSAGREIDDRQDVARVLQGMASVAVARDDPERALQLYGAAEGVRQAIGAATPPSLSVIHIRSLERARAKFAPEAAEAAFQRGRVLPLEEALALALKPATAP